mmetsp:Transcript_19337/g.26178  ORF Transcript_19337/g.26178 Transcript_19337/m.26178 type:complete len:143 (-) Transcript_19337:208-636(-)
MFVLPSLRSKYLRLMQSRGSVLMQLCTLQAHFFRRNIAELLGRLHKFGCLWLAWLIIVAHVVLKVVGSLAKDHISGRLNAVKVSIAELLNNFSGAFGPLLTRRYILLEAVDQRVGLLGHLVAQFEFSLHGLEELLGRVHLLV